MINEPYVQGDNGVFAQIALGEVAQLALMPDLIAIPVTDGKILDYMQAGLLHGFWMLGTQENRTYNISELCFWFHQKIQPFVDKASSCIFGGPGGMRWMLFMLTQYILEVESQERNPVQLANSRFVYSPASVAKYFPYLADIVMKAL